MPYMLYIGRGRNSRRALLTRRAEDAVNDYLQERKRLQRGRGIHSTALFIGFQPRNKRGRQNRLSPSGARLICDRAALCLGLARFHPSQLRHTYGLVLFRYGHLTRGALGTSPRSLDSSIRHSHYWAMAVGALQHEGL